MISWTELGKYFGIFGSLVVSAFGVPIPEELPIITGGVLVGKDWNNPDSWMKWWIMLPVVIAGVVVCDLVLYLIGRKWGTRLLKRKWVQRRILTPEKRTRIERNFHDYGIMILLVARLLPGIRSPIFIMAGVMRVSFRKFIIADLLYAIPGVNLLFWLSYWFTDQFQRAFEKVEGNRPIVMAVILAGVAGFLLYHYFVRRRVTTGDPEELPVIVKQVASSISHQLHLGHADAQNGEMQPPTPDSASPPSSESYIGAGNTIAVNANAVHFVVTGSSRSVAGTAFPVSVAAVDPSGKPNTSFVGTVHFTSTDPLAALPADYTFVPGDAGIHVFSSVTLATAGTQAITATDPVSGNIIGALSVVVTSAGASQFVISAPRSSTAGMTFDFGVTALDSSGNVATGYDGTVHFTSSDVQASLPADTTFSNGVGSFSATLAAAGTQSIVATDTANSSTTGNASVAVNASAASRFSVTGPTSTVVGTAFNVTVAALDPFGNIATSYLGSVHFTSSDPNATLPADYTFVAGDAGSHVFTSAVTLNSAGVQSIIATDTTTSTLTGSEARITVTPAGATSLTAAGFAAHSITAPRFDATNVDQAPENPSEVVKE